MATEKAAQTAQQAKRKDPPVRWTGTVGDGMVIVNGDPSREYCLVRRDETSIGQYEMRGYETELRREGGPRLAMDPKPKPEDHGKRIECMGHVLMSIDKQLLAQYRKFGGPLHGMGTAHWDQIEKRLKSKGGSAEQLAGTHHGFINVAADDPAASMEG